MSDALAQYVTIGCGLVVIIGGVAAWVKLIRPRLHKAANFLGRIDETINGREPVRDSYGRELAPAIPPLVEQQATVQAQIGRLTELVAELVSHREEIEAVKTVQLLHTKQIAANAENISDLKANVYERIAGRIDSAAAFNAIAEVAKDNGSEGKSE